MKFRFLIKVTLMLLVLSNEKASSQDSVRTEVFTLSTCNPGNSTLIKELPGPGFRKEYVSKLEVRSNKPNVLKISGINPLRYKYYINNEAVTQFMESSPITLAINTFANGDYLISAPEIKVPEIFKTDSISSKVKLKILEYQRNHKLYEDSIESIDFRISQRWDELLGKASFDTVIAARHGNDDAEYRQLFNQLDRFRKRRDQNLIEFQMYTSGLPLNNPKFGILEQYYHSDLSEKIEPNIDSIRSFQKNFAKEYRQHNRRFKTIDSLLFLLEGDELFYSYRSRANRGDVLSLLIDTLRYYNFTWPRTRYHYYDYTNQNSTEYKINNLKQQMLNKRFQLYEEFVLHVVTKIGVLVQNQFREYSSFNNSLEHFKCIDAQGLEEIKERKQRLGKTFEFIQKTSAELQIMVSYLDINTELYQNIAKKINNNYVFLLSYLKNLEFITNETTVQYTLPTHTNLKNVDLIRYTVKREDKITKSTHTHNYDFWLRGGLKIDFSIGFFGTRLTDNVYNKVLLDTAGGIDRIRITRQDDGRMNFAFGGMVNIAQRNGASWINLGASIGVAYSNNQKLQVLTGLSLHLGKTERLIVHSGVGFGTIKYLDISANDFKFYDRDLKSVEREKLSSVKEHDRVYMLESRDIKFSSYAIPTVDKFVMRPFIGISYNLSKKNALQAVSGTGVSTFAENYTNGVGF